MLLVFVLFLQDFVRLPWQNQSNQNVNAVPLVSSAPPGSGALHRGYSSGSAQPNPAIFSGSSGINAVAHSLDPEDMEPNSVKLLRCVGICWFYMFPFFCVIS